MITNTASYETEEYYLLEYDTVASGRSLPSEKQERCHKQWHVVHLAYSLSLKLEAVMYLQNISKKLPDNEELLRK
jgi:hypothetical protein